MNDTKSIIRIIQDYCSKEGYNNLLHEFSISLSQALASYKNLQILSGRQFEILVKKRNDFIISNDIDLHPFSRNLYKKLSYELSFINSDILYNELVKFKNKFENGTCQGLPKEVNEDLLRSFLVMSIDKELFMEARCSTGRSDIIIPESKAIIETKLWKGLEYYKEGLPELIAYLQAQRYPNGYYIVFDDSKTENVVIKSQNGNSVFEEKYEGHIIKVLFIQYDKTRPSKIYAAKRLKK